jgi:hypothetical protein
MPTTTEFDTFYHDQWSGEMTATVLDNDNTPNRVLDVTQGWNIKVRWSLQSEDPDIAPVDLITQGHWRLEAFAESIGTAPGGFEGTVAGPVDVPWGAGGSSSMKTWEKILPVSQGLINTPGIYKVTVMIQYHKETNVFTSMVGFAEYPLICFSRLP